MKLKRGFKIFLLGIILILSIFIILKKNPIEKNNSKYSAEVIEKAKELGIEKKLNDYSKTLEYMILNNYYLDEYIKDYEKIDYVEKDNFGENINTLLKKDYSSKEINSIYEHLNDKNITKLLNSDYKDLTNYYEIKNLDVDKIDRYTAYIKKNNLDIKDGVTRVNIGLDKEFYSDIKEVEKDPDDILVLVNKYNALPSDYVPDDLVSLSNGSQFQLRKIAADAYEKLIDKAESVGIEVLPFSGYRSYSTQKVIYNNHVNNNGKEKADTYSARPGHSEHQLGLAVDIRSKDYELKRLTPDDAKWINKNCSEFGFIIRYTKEDEAITGYMEETWHLRYVGKDIAKEVMDLGITYDEYYDLYIKEY